LWESVRDLDRSSDGTRT